jgi:hypothetical protein
MAGVENHQNVPRAFRDLGNADCKLLVEEIALALCSTVHAHERLALAIRAEMPELRRHGLLGSVPGIIKKGDIVRAGLREMSLQTLEDERTCCLRVQEATTRQLISRRLCPALQHCFDREDVLHAPTERRHRSRIGVDADEKRVYISAHDVLPQRGSSYGRRIEVKQQRRQTHVPRAAGASPGNTRAPRLTVMNSVAPRLSRTIAARVPATVRRRSRKGKREPLHLPDRTSPTRARGTC